MVGMLFNVARQVVQPTLGRIFVENAIRAAFDGADECLSRNWAG